MRRTTITFTAVLMAGAFLAPAAGAQIITETELISDGLAPGNEVYASTGFAEMSPDAARVYFVTDGSLTADDTDGGLSDLYEGTGSQTRLISTSADNPDGGEFFPELDHAAPDGSRVVFSTRSALDDADTDVISDVYVRVGDQTYLASPAPDDDEPFDPSADFVGATADGTRVWFGTYEALVAEDQDEAHDVYEWAGVEGEVELISTGPLDAPGNEVDEFMAFAGSSDDGSRVIFFSNIPLTVDDADDETDLYVREGDVTTLVTPAPSEPLPEPGVAAPEVESVSADGSRVYGETADGFATGDDDESIDVYAFEGGQATLLTPGTQMNVTYWGRTSGAATLFLSTDEGLVEADTDGQDDLYERSNGQYTLLSTGPDAEGGEFDVDVEAITGDGSRVFFETAERLVAEDHDGSDDLYARDADGLTLVSNDDTGSQFPEYQWSSADGTRVLYETDDDDIYVFDGGPAVRLFSGEPDIRGLSSDGSRLVFQSYEQYAAEDTDPEYDVYRATLAFPPGNTAPPVISGTAAVGQTLTCSTGTWSVEQLEYGYQWNVDGTPIPGATTASYIAAPADANAALTCTVTATNGAGSTSATSATVTVTPAAGPPPPPPPPPPAGPAPGACANRQTGTAAGDALTGTDAGDLLRGLAGDDVLRGLGGADCLTAGAGEDRLSGDAGADRLSGGKGGDALGGGGGADRLTGGAGDDALAGGRGADRLKGDAGVDRLTGGSGDDVILAADGEAETVRCGAGGRDRVVADREDRLRGCERTRRAR